MKIPVRCSNCGHGYKLDEELIGRRAKCKECGQPFLIERAKHDKPAEVTSGGTPVYRPEKKIESDDVPEVTPWMQRIVKHVEKHLGPSGGVFHEIVSDTVHLDLLIVPPSHKPESENHPLGTNHFTIVTMGMSAKPMNVPQTGEEGLPSKYAELMIALPPNWPGMRPDGKFDKNMMEDEANWWPFHWLKAIARMIHEYDTFLGVGTTIPNGEEAAPYAPNTKLGCMMSFPPVLCPGVHKLLIDDDTTIEFYALWPLYKEEMQLKLNKGLNALITKLREAEATELIQIDRPNLCKKKGWFGK